MSSQILSFRNIDNALALYYRRLGHSNYRNADGNGIFLQYVIDEELLDDDVPIEKKLGDGCDPNNCCYLGMDKETGFPIPDYAVIHAEQKEAFIFYLIQYCYKHSQPPSDKYIREHLVPKLGGTIFGESVEKTIVLPLNEESTNNQSTKPNIKIKHSGPNPLDVKVLSKIKQIIDSTSPTVMNQIFHHQKHENKQLFAPTKQFRVNVNNGSEEANKEENKEENDEHDDDDDDDEQKQSKQDIKLNVNAPQLTPKKTVKCEEKGSKWDLLPIKCAGTIEIPRDFTQNIIPSTIKENISNIYYFMDKSTALRANKKILTNENVVIINYDFHDKDTDKILYCIIKKQNPSKHRGFSWIMMDRLFTKKEIYIQFNISERDLILPLSSRYELRIIQQMDHIHQIYNILQRQSIFGIIERTQWHRIPIYNKTNNKKRKVLHLTKKEFMKTIDSRILNDKHINIISIMILNKNKEYWIEHIYIIKIDENVHIGISMKYKPHWNQMEVTGIHLNKEYILNKHQLAAPNHYCQCLDHFESDIDDLQIGNIDEDKNRIKDLQKRHEMIKNENNNLKKQEAFYKKKYFELKQLLLSEAKDDLNENDEDLALISTVPTITPFPI